MPVFTTSIHGAENADFTLMNSAIKNGSIYHYLKILIVLLAEK